MRKSLVYFLCFVSFVFMGCGSDSGDPTARITTLTAVPESVSPGGSTVITATVARAGGTTTATTGTTTGTTTPTAPSGWGENITFRLLTANGAQLSVLTQKTDGDGKARTVYTAGNNYSQDVIQATLDNGMSLSIVIRKTGNVTGGSIKITEPTTPASVKALGYISIVATVTESNDSAKPVSGETVEFKLVENNSGASLTIRSAVTNATGQAVATYRAGGNQPAQDIVQAKLLSNGTVSTIVINVAAPASGPSISLKATPTSVKAFGYSIIQATVTDGNDPTKPIGGVPVVFKLVENNSGATLTVQSAVSDATGQAIATYRAGGNGPVQDVVQAQLPSTGSVSSVILDVAAVSPGLSIVVAASPVSVTVGQVSIITATLTGDNNAGVAVMFSLPVNSSGATLSATTATTDGSGRAVVIYLPGTANPTLSVQDTVQAAVGSLNSAVAITRSVPPTSAFSITVAASPTTLASDGSNSVITANVKNNAGTVISGMTVNFTVTGSAPLGTLSVPSATTDGSGNAVTVFRGNGVGATGTQEVVTAGITVGGNTYTSAVIITYP